MQFFKRLPAQSFVAAGGDSGATQDLKLIPSAIDGRPVIVRSLQIRLNGTVTSTAGGAANLARLLSRIQLSIPGIGDLVNLTGNEVVRIYRAERRGAYPPIGALTNAKVWDGVATLAPGANAVDLTIVVDFARPFAVDPDDTALPAALLRSGATLKFSYLAALTDIIADCTAVNIAMTCKAVCALQSKAKAPVLTVLDSVGLVGSQPVVMPCPGRIMTAVIAPDAQGVFPAGTDLTQVGFRAGNDEVFTEIGQTVRDYYNAFNDAASNPFEDHVDAQTHMNDSIPLTGPFAPGLESDHPATTDAIGTGYPIALNFDVAAHNYKLLRRFSYDQRSGQALAAIALIGGTPQSAQPASGKQPPGGSGFNMPVTLA